MRRHLELLYGPQDGSKVSTSTTKSGVPHCIYVGPKWLGDGYAAFTTNGPSGRFPMLYVFNGSAYEFRGNRKNWKLDSAR